MCRCNDRFLNRLLGEIDDPLAADSLPTCAARCGIFLAGNTLSVKDTLAIQRYLLAVNHDATIAHACRRKGSDPPDTFDIEVPGLPSDAIFDMACPLARRRKTRVSSIPAPSLDIPVWPDAVALGDVPPPWRFWDAPSVDYDVLISSDGSFSPDDRIAGWGFTAARTGHPRLLDACGPVCLDASLPTFIGAGILTNNTGELCAIVHGLNWLSSLPPGLRVSFQFDSLYASNVIRRIWRARANLALVLSARDSFDKARLLHDIRWEHTRAHQGSFFNERADLLAGYGATLSSPCVRDISLRSLLGAS